MKRKFNFLVQNYCCYYYYNVNCTYLSQLNTTNFKVNSRSYNNFLMVFQIYFSFCKCPNNFWRGGEERERKKKKRNGETRYVRPANL